MSGRTFKAEKDPQAIEDFQIDWENYIGSATITSSSWTAEGNITVDNDSNTTTTATVWLSGGRAGTVDRVTNSVVLSNGAELERSIEILIRDL